MNNHYSSAEASQPTNPLLIVAFWLYVGIPLAWGVWSTLQKATALFH
ncbi:MAG TPA: oxalate:formate antiporter [Oxalicibacterium sp.]|nr:oxalate:formate antiporter [Oxalicibacterium sp.]HWU99311.1 oxalate:formate antiporter [Oxalicibacterium sp.]